MSLPRSQQRHSNVAIVRYQHDGITLEVPCYKNKVVAYRQGLESNPDEVLQIARIFTNVSRGEYASLSDIRRALESRKISEIDAIKKLLEIGDLQVGADERKEEESSVRRDVITMVAQKCTHPVTRRHYPFAMIEQALQKIGFSFTLTQEAKPQALRAIQELVAKQVIPIRRAPMRIRICSAESLSVVAFLQQQQAENIVVRQMQAQQQATPASLVLPQSVSAVSLPQSASAASLCSVGSSPQKPTPPPPPALLSSAGSMPPLPFSASSTTVKPMVLSFPALPPLPATLSFLPPATTPAPAQQQQPTINITASATSNASSPSASSFVTPVSLANKQSSNNIVAAAHHPSSGNKSLPRVGSTGNVGTPDVPPSHSGTAAAAAATEGSCGGGGGGNSSNNNTATSNSGGQHSNVQAQRGVMQDVLADVSPDLFRTIDAWVGKSLPEGSSLTVITPVVADTSEGDATALSGAAAAASAGGSLSATISEAATSSSATPASLANNNSCSIGLTGSASPTPGRPGGVASGTLFSSMPSLAGFTPSALASPSPPQLKQQQRQQHNAKHGPASNNSNATTGNSEEDGAIRPSSKKNGNVKEKQKGVSPPSAAHQDNNNNNAADVAATATEQHLSAKQKAKLRREQREMNKNSGAHKNKSDDDDDSGSDTDGEGGGEGAGKRGKRHGGLKPAVKTTVDPEEAIAAPPSAPSSDTEDSDDGLSRKDKLKKIADRERAKLETALAAAEAAEEAWKDGEGEEEEEEDAN